MIKTAMGEPRNYPHMHFHLNMSNFSNQNKKCLKVEINYFGGMLFGGI